MTQFRLHNGFLKKKECRKLKIIWKTKKLLFISSKKKQEQSLWKVCFR